METTNEDIMDRLDMMERKVDKICAKMEQANGAWTLLKWLGTLACGSVVFYNSVRDWFR